MTPVIDRAEDQRLVEGLQRGEAHAIESLVARYGARIQRVASRLLGDPRDAEEVTQDVLLAVIRNIATFKGQAALSSWLYRISTNAAYDRLRARRSRAEVSLEPLLPVFDDEGRHIEPVADWSTRLDDPGVAADTRSALEQAIQELPADHRVVLVLRDVEGLSNEETAEAVGATVAAVKSRLHRARLFLRQKLAHGFARRPWLPPPSISP